MRTACVKLLLSPHSITKASPDLRHRSDSLGPIPVNIYTTLAAIQWHLLYTAAGGVQYRSHLSSPINPCADEGGFKLPRCTVTAKPQVLRAPPSKRALMSMAPSSRTRLTLGGGWVWVVISVYLLKSVWVCTAWLKHHPKGYSVSV